ncbi:hypothetical protein QN277_002637 [Acacia crassicarpa]|uniref:BHLH domain-containing protein n=1 Tax=Acacia crassicarpa TaxID=499986 RepID=A0AAE1TI42_9FABA|nr:hypothetical protein QN277_002637 [Acacia crassicarpa]
MAEDQFQATGNWWDSASTRNSTRFETEASQSSNFAWQDTDMSSHHDLKPRSSMAASPSSSDPNPNLHMMGLGLSSQTLDWNQPSFLRGAEKGGGESSFLNASSTNFQQESAMMGLSPQVQWRDKLFSAESSSSTNEFKRGFSLDQTQFSPQYSSGESTVTTQGLASSPNFQMDLYGNSSILQGLLGPDNNNNSQVQYDHQNRQINLPYQSSSYGLNSNDQLMPPWSKVPQFLRASPPKQQQPPHNNNSQLHFANNAPFWNTSEASNIKDVRSGFFPSLQPPFPSPSFDVQSKNMCEVRESSSVAKKSASEAAPKRPRSETPSPLPAFKVRKEKMGDRITALQQLVSPFGKTDTASVLSEATAYIKFLHEQVLSTPYMKSGAPIQHQQSPGKSKEGEGRKQDLRSRGLCLVPVSITFPVTQETAVDFWTPTFGGTFR